MITQVVLFSIIPNPQDETRHRAYKVSHISSVLVLVIFSGPDNLALRCAGSRLRIKFN